MAQPKPVLLGALHTWQPGQQQGKLTLTMSEIHIRRTHNLSADKVRAGAERIAAELQQRFQLETGWEDNQLVFSRTGLTGTLQVEPEAIEIRLQLGLLLSVFRRQMETEIHRFLDERFGPA